jgi:histidinol-phosphate aminotransferase
VGNGSDDLLTVATRTFVQPRGLARSPSAETVQFFSPGYSLYPVLAGIHGARIRRVALRKNFALPALPDGRAARGWDPKAALTFVTTPNAPSGRGYATRELDAWCRDLRGVVVLDEAYADFAAENAMQLAIRHPHVLVSRTFSKAYSLCYLRIGYFVGHASLIAAMDKVRDSYNVNGLGQIAALAALEDAAYYRANFKRIIATRERLAASLLRLGFEVFPSQTNFLLVKPPGRPAQVWLDNLRARKILVRWFPAPEVCAHLRITLGTDRQADALLRAVRGQLRRDKIAVA